MMDPLLSASQAPATKEKEEVEEELLILTKDPGDDNDDDDSYTIGSSTKEEVWSSSSLLSLPSSMTMAKAKQEVIEQSRYFLPALQNTILSKIPWIYTLRVLGRMDALSSHSNSGKGRGVQLAAAALATTICNVTGMSLCVGFSFALSTLAGQAKGEMFSRASSAAEASRRMNSDYAKNNSKLNSNSNSTRPYSTADMETGKETTKIDTEAIPIMPVVFLLRGLLLQAALLIPVGIWWLLGIKSVLVRLGQTEELAIHASFYLKILVPSLWLFSIECTTRVWTQSIGMADVPVQASLLGLGLHVPFNLLFCDTLGLGYLGCAYATNAFQLVQCSYIVYYLFYNEGGRQRVLQSTGGSAVGRKNLKLWYELQIAAGSLKGFCDYLGLAIPGIIGLSNWWACETAIFLAGRLNPNPQTTLASMTMIQSINSLCFKIPQSFAIAGTARVGNLLGAGNDTGAALAGSVSVGCCAIGSATIALLLCILPHDFLPVMLRSSEDVYNHALIDQTAALIPWMAVYHFFDSIQAGFYGIITGCGRQHVVMPIAVFSWWIVGVPLAYYLGLYRNGGNDSLCAVHLLGDNKETLDEEDALTLCGDVGLVAGMVAGGWCHMVLIATVVVATTDWKNETYKAKQRVIADQTKTERKKR